MKGKALTVRPLRAPLQANRALRFARALAGGARLLAPARPAGLAAPARLEMVHRLGMGGWNGRVDVTFAPVDLRLAVSLRQSLELRLWLEARAAGTAVSAVGRSLEEGRTSLAGIPGTAGVLAGPPAVVAVVARPRSEPGPASARPAREGRPEASSPARALAPPPASGWEVRSWGAAPMAGPVPVRATGEVLLRVRVAGEGAVAVPVAMPQAARPRSERTVAEMLARSATEREVFLKAVRAEARKEAAQAAAGRPAPDRQVETLLRELLRFPERAAAAIVWNALPAATRAALGEPRQGRRRKAWGFNPRTEAHIKPQPRRGDGMGRGVETPRAAAVPSGLGNLGGRFPGVETPGFRPAPPAGAFAPTRPVSTHLASAGLAHVHPGATRSARDGEVAPPARRSIAGLQVAPDESGLNPARALEAGFIRRNYVARALMPGRGAAPATVPLVRPFLQVFLRPLSPSLPREGGGRPLPLTSGELLLPSSRDDSAAAPTAASGTVPTWRPLEQPVARTATAPSTPPAEQVRLIRAASEKKVAELVKTEVASALSAASAASRLTRNDVSRIADQVYSTLGRRLTVEKERRG